MKRPGENEPFDYQAKEQAFRYVVKVGDRLRDPHMAQGVDKTGTISPSQTPRPIAHGIFGAPVGIAMRGVRQCSLNKEWLFPAH